MQNRVLLSVKRFRQQPSECAIAAMAALANFYDKKISYAGIRHLIPAKVRQDGLWSSQQGRLLNKLGYSKVTIVTADLSLVDYSWINLSKEELIKKLKKLRAHYGRKRDNYSKRWVNDMIDWLSDSLVDNQLKISQDFPKIIKRYLNNGRPVGASLNWTSLHKFQKEVRRPNGDINGEVEEHAIVIRGYDDKGIFVVDSHSQYYNGKRAKFKNGYYKVTWEKYLVNAPYGDLILVS